jgi:TonB family protein
MNAAAIRETWEGQLLDGSFPLLQWLGGSERSAVFLTELSGEQPRKAAIKLIPADAGYADSRVSRWQATSRLSHPHLIRLFHAGQCEVNATPLLYVVMEYAEEDLSQVLPSRPLTPAEAAEMLPAVIDALSYLHEKGLVHGRLQPSNIVVVDNQVKLSSDSIHAPGEFGARMLAASVYSAPEAAILPAADLWSLGATLVTALTQRPPAWDKSGLEDPILPESIPEPLRDIVRACLRRDPEGRCTLEQIRARLQPGSAPLPAAVRPVQTAERPVPAPARTGQTVARPAAVPHLMRRVTVPIVAGLVALAVLLGMRLASHRTQAVPPPATNQAEQLPASSAPAPTASQAEPPHASSVPASTTKQAEQADTSTAPPPSPVRSPEASAGPRKGAVVPGAVAQRVVPDVPPSARNTIQGTVRVSVRVSVDPDGEVMAATLDSRGPSRYFANLALQAARAWRFQPPQVSGQSVASEWILRFHFGQTGTQVLASPARAAVQPPPTT